MIFIKNRPRKYLKGYRFISKEGFECEVIEVLDGADRLVEILDGNGYKKIIKTTSINSRTIANPYYKKSSGVGYIGVGKYMSTNSKIKNKNFYDTWNKMLKRCYSGIDHTYDNVEVDSKWHNYQNFMDFVERTYPFKHENIKFSLDKDLLQQGVKNKIYSENTCVWIPTRINSYIQNKNNKDRGIFYKNGHYEVASTLFEKGGIGYYIGSSVDKEVARKIYNDFKTIQDEKARQFLRNLDYLDEKVISLVKSPRYEEN